MDRDFELVHTITDWYDGPRVGIADYLGRPHLYERGWDHADDNFANSFLLSPVNRETFSLAMEDWEIWRRWRTAFDRGEATIETYPALPEDPPRHDELARVLSARLVTDRAKAIRKAAEWGISFTKVRWHDPPRSIQPTNGSMLTTDRTMRPYPVGAGRSGDQVPGAGSEVMGITAGAL